MPSSLQLWGIANCSTVKKARQWLDNQAVDYHFFDFKKNPPTQAALENWLAQSSLETLLNRKGTTWRKLTAQQQSLAHQVPQAIALMMQYASLIKRPLLLKGDRLLAVGFSEEKYHPLFQ